MCIKKFSPLVLCECFLVKLKKDHLGIEEYLLLQPIYETADIWIIVILKFFSTRPYINCIQLYTVIHMHYG